jgi:hypothetical protein
MRSRQVCRTRACVGALFAAFFAIGCGGDPKSDATASDGKSGKSASGGKSGTTGTGGKSSTANGGKGGSGGSNGTQSDGKDAGASDSGGSGSGKDNGGDTGNGGASGSGGAGSTPTTGAGAACKGIAASVTDATASGAAISVKIKVADSACVVASDFVGANYESFANWGADVSMNDFQKDALQQAGIQLLRYPGGAPGDWLDLLMSDKCSDGSDANWGAPSYTKLWDFAKSAGVRELMLQTNPTAQWCGEGNQDASGEHAAAIAADAKSKGVPVVFEIGNEPDIGDSWFGKNGGQDAYIAKFIDQAKGIHSANPKAEVYGPVVCGLGSNCTFPSTWDSGFIGAFLAQTGDKASGDGKGTVDGVSLHVYWHHEYSFSDLTEAKITKYGFAVYWANTVMPYMRELIAKYDSRDLPVAISEISIGNGIQNDDKQTQNMFSALETTDTIAAFASSGVRSFQWFDANAEGPMDFWLFTKDALKPIYYSFVLWSKMGDHVLDVSSSVNPVDVAVYATRRGDAVQVLIINKTDSSHDVAIAFDGFDPSGKQRTQYDLEPATAGDDTSMPVYNGTAAPDVSNLPAPKTSDNTEGAPSVTVAPFSIALLAFGS